MIKQCVVCGVEFAVNRSPKITCSTGCLKQHRDNRDRFRLRNSTSDLGEARKEHIRKLSRESQARYRAKIKAIDPEGYNKKRRQSAERWRTNNIEKVRERERQYMRKRYVEHPEKIKEIQQRFYNKRAAALRLLEEIETKGLGALL